LNIVKTFKSLSRIQSATAFITLVGLSFWQFQQVNRIRPAILGDEYIYSANSRLTNFWEVPLQGDFSNYLFNFVYKVTLVCGEDFYSCAKGLNSTFFLLTLLLLLFISLSLSRSFWLSLIVVASLALSPVAIYTSLFLPESLYFFLMTVIFAFLIQVIADPSHRTWAGVGIAFGLAALVKPHAVLSLPAVIVFAVVMTVVQRSTVGDLAKKALWFGLSFLIIRFGFGFLIAGPSALGLAGQYLGETAVANLTQSEGQVAGNNIPDAIASLFLPMLANHWASTVALFAMPLAAVVLNLVGRIRAKQPSVSSSASLLVLIWLLVLLIVVALFTGYVTGTGDDHSTRMLLRYYEFLYLFIPVVGLSSVVELSKQRESALWLRVAVAILVAPGIFYAFGGLFDRLTIQIADAPTLAGLIPDFTILSVISTASILSIGLLIFWPDSLKTLVITITVAFSLLTGYETFNQYEIARGSDSQADVAGYATRNYLKSEGLGTDAKVVVIAQTRFEATNAAFWIDSDKTIWDYYAPGILNREVGILDDGDFMLGLGGVMMEDGAVEVASGDGYVLYRLIERDE
jgi:hypothetical protein